MMSRPMESVHHGPFTLDLKKAEGNGPLPTPNSTHLSEPAHADMMDVTPPPPSSMGPPGHSSPNGDLHNHTHPGVDDSRGVVNTTAAAAAAASSNASSLSTAPVAAAATQQPKVVQTAFIHKLYNMLEDPNIQHLISWSTTNESFVMSPSNEFAKVLAQYFKHTNISSFVRQLNMYGFHKVSDVFHTGAPESTLWEFKHGNGNFKRGDLVGLREIKRRASRHALINRDSFSSAPKASMSQPGTPAEPIVESVDARLAHLEHNLYDVHARLARSEDQNASLSARYQSLTDGLMRCHQWNHDLSHFLSAMVPDPDSLLQRDISNMKKEIARQRDMLRSLDEPPELLFSGRPPHFSNLSLDNQPVSPRQAPVDDVRRMNMGPAPRQGHFFRPPVPPMPHHLSVSPRKYGSLGNVHTSPSSLRPHAPPPPPSQHPLASVTSPTANIIRRHTSADIRLHGWQGSRETPYSSGHSSGQWPSSPSRTHVESSQHVRDVLAQYEIRPSTGSRQTTPPLTSDTTASTTSAESGWGFGGPKFGLKAGDTSAPPTRRSSMASNVHSLLNPAETVERADEDEVGNDDRKRKRLQ
ncbi:MAG: hypothetical protein M1838_001068 [Thelocarpon superellum]|nr:MAG: hypothetical protein M1838_001068 [Thelocarpon superellum]